MNDSPTNSTTPPGPPGELTGVVYTDTEVEVFWTDATDNVAVVGYDVTRNSVLLAPSLDAKSYFDASVQPATDYTYSVQAVDNEGTRGPSLSINLTTPAIMPTLRQSNYFLIIDQVFDFFTAEAYDTHFEFSPGGPLPGSPTDSYEFSFDNTSYAFYNEYVCDNGGIATSRGTFTSCDGRCQSRTRMYYACVIEGETLLGRVDFIGDFSSSSTFFNELSVTPIGGRSLSINGALMVSQLGGKVSTRYERVSVVSRYESPNFQGATVVTDANTTFGYGSLFDGSDVSAKMFGSLMLRSPTTGNKSVSVSTPVEFINEISENRNFPVGTLLIQADDGSRIEFNADNGDESTVNIVLTIDGSTETIVEPWSLWLDRLTWPE